MLARGEGHSNFKLGQGKFLLFEDCSFIFVNKDIKVGGGFPVQVGCASWFSQAKLLQDRLDRILEITPHSG